ncbi:hypothetical protein ACFWBN_02115 [Streptomyces sp. NPDC059989]|uniref:hypothetical protein n=1 Tax=Streptomyces sp. NPDC059989 TaxID=3347026 RepID=UPI0036986D5C
MSGAAGDEYGQRIAARLNFLFDRIYRRGGSPQTGEEVSAATGVPLDHLARLRSGEPAEDGPADAELFRARLEHLFDTRTTAAGDPFKRDDVAKACDKSRVWLYNVTSGKSKPSWESTVQLAAVFGVETSYFADTPLQALARHFGVEAGAEFFLAPDDSEVVRDTRAHVELLAMLREAGGIPALLGRMAGPLPVGRDGDRAGGG